jgi:hypothetical protein
LDSSLEEVVRLPSILSGYREAEEDDSSLSAVLDSILPSFNVNRNPEPLPIFLGKKVIDIKLDIGSSSSQTGKGGKAFTWSQGLASEISPIKTRSSCKK